MPEGKCAVCGEIYHGWALIERITYCDKCQSVVLLMEGEYRWVKQAS